MEKFIIKGGRKLKGTITVSGSKNASLPILFSSILSKRAEISNVPNLKDVRTTLNLLSLMGLNVETSNRTVVIEKSKNVKTEAPYELVKTMRASILCLGPLLTRYGKAKVSLPGGCAIGTRPIDLHLKSFSKMGADIKLDHGYVVAEAKNGLKGAEIAFDYPTVGGTENIMMAAVLSKGRTVIRNAAREPEIVDLARALKSGGARIEGEGTGTIVIDGVDEIESIKHTVMPDRIEAETFLAAVASAGGKINIRNFPIKYSRSVIDKLSEAGLNISTIDETTLEAKKNKPLTATNIVTQPYPGFPTDMQAQFMAAMTLAEGTSTITETVFENRFMHVWELQRLGAKIRVEGNTAVVTGSKKLVGAKVTATDLRASASLVIAGLAAENTTEVYRIYHIDRGYESLEEKLLKLGAYIKRVPSELPY